MTLREGTFTGISATLAGTTQTGSDISLPAGTRGVQMMLDADLVGSPTSPTLDVKLQRKDEVSGEYEDITGAALAQKTADATESLMVYPGMTVVANRSVSNHPGQVIRVVATIGGTGYSASVGWTLTVGITPLS